jgi:hypothetical protein
LLSDFRHRIDIFIGNDGTDERDIPRQIPFCGEIPERPTLGFQAADKSVQLPGHKVETIVEVFDHFLRKKAARPGAANPVARFEEAAAGIVEKADFVGVMESAEGLGDVGSHGVDCPSKLQPHDLSRQAVPRHHAAPQLVGDPLCFGQDFKFIKPLSHC